MARSKPESRRLLHGRQRAPVCRFGIGILPQVVVCHSQSVQYECTTRITRLERLADPGGFPVKSGRAGIVASGLRGRGLIHQHLPVVPLS